MIQEATAAAVAFFYPVLQVTASLPQLFPGLIKSRTFSNQVFSRMEGGTAIAILAVTAASFIITKN